MKKIPNEQWQFPQNDPRVVVGAKVARLYRGKVKAIGTIANLTPAQFQTEGLRPELVKGNEYRYHRDNGRRIGGDPGEPEYVVLATEAHIAEFEQQQAEAKRERAEQERRIAEREAVSARNTETNLRRYVALIRAAGSDEAAMEHLQQFADRAGWYGLGAEWPESEGE